MAEKPKKDEEAIFYQALEKSPGDREAYLKKACGDDNELYSRVKALLKSHAVDDNFLESPPLGGEVTLDKSPLAEGPGTVIGAYKLLEKIGEGGMAVVYMAEQKEPLRRKVALKIIKLGMDTKQVIARFEAERQALAIMEHPNVAKVFDAGATETGRPYFVMELVKGVSITEYCDKNKLSTKERLDLFVQVCNAVQHAHQKGIIHRDIKPSNVMVTMHDDKAVPKVIDFGIAKATGQKLTEKTLFTRYAQMIGTPTYMSPEQAQFSGLDIDTRTDIYSLGVLLYALLTGTTPFDAEELRSKGYGEIQRIIQETEPPKPSTKLSTMGEALTGVAEHRQTKPDLLTKLVRGDLDWIVMKTLEKDRTRRYETANALAADIKRHFDDEPVEAGPPSTLYRTRKFMQKHRRTVAAVVAIAATLIIGLVVSTTLYFVADQARATAQQAEKTASEKAESLRRALYVNNIQLADAKYREGNISRVRELLDSCPDDLRGWEWYRLNHISDQALMTLQGHPNFVYSAAFSPDGKRIVSGSQDKTVKVWDATSGSEVMTLSGHTKTVYSVAFSPDGKRIVSGSYDKTVKVWDAASGTEILTLHGHGQGITCVAFAPDGKRIVSGSRDKTVKVWDATIDRELMTLRGGSGFVFSPDGKRIVGSKENTIKLWDAATGAELMVLRGHGGRHVTFSPDGKRIVLGSNDGAIKVWDASTGAEVMTLREHSGGVYPYPYSLALSPDGKRIVSGGWDPTIKVWDAGGGPEVLTLLGDGPVMDVAISPDGKRIVSSSWDDTIKVWDVRSGAELMTLRGHESTVTSAVFSRDGERIVSASYDRTVKLWDALTATELMTLPRHTNRVLSVVFSPDGNTLAVGVGDGNIILWESGPRPAVGGSDQSGESAQKVMD